MATEMVERRETGMTMQSPTPAMMLQAAIERGTDMDQLTKLMDLQERWEANEARKAYVRAMAEFKSEPLKVTKSKTVSFGNGGRTAYTHATLADVVEAVVHALSAHGLSHRWETKQENNLVTVACVITHDMGHSERTELSAPADSSGSKNNIQAIGSTVTYLQRYTLMAATGLAAKDMDDDGRTAAPADKINGSQHDTLMAKLEATNSDVGKFCAAFGIEDVRDLPASQFDEAMKKLAMKAKRNA